MAQRFDTWTKQFGAQHDRRGVLTVAGAGVLGLLGLATQRESAQAKQCNRNSDCPNAQPKCKKGTCVECQNDGDCRRGEKCRRNRCKLK